MDVQMPEVNGYEATSFIRDHEIEKKILGIPIVGVTADAQDSTRKKCMEEGMNDYITKPIVVKELNNILNKYL